MSNFRPIDQYQERAIGLPYPITLIGIAEGHYDKGDRLIGTCVPEVVEIAEAVAKAFLFFPEHLSMVELRFIRRVFGPLTPELVLTSTRVDHPLVQVKKSVKGYDVAIDFQDPEQ
jgi:hypothetical protein